MDASANVTHIVKSLDAAAENDLMQRLSSWFSAPNPSSNLKAAQTKRQEDTGVWLLSNPIYLSWKKEDHSLLWLHGKAGSGKTILSSTVISSLVDDYKSNTIVTYFYFDFQAHEKQLYHNFLNSIVVQLFSQNGHVSTILEELYNACDRGRSRPTIQDTLGVLRRIIDATAASVYVVVDALDECRDRINLLEGLEEIRRWDQGNLHIFVTSRREPEIEDILSPLATDTITLEESVVDEDILTYVRYHLRHDFRLSKWSEKIREEIETALVNGANGMFRWVECQLNAIRDCMKLGLLRKALRTLPKTLDETYTRILEKIPQEHVEDARRILSCLVCAFCPLAIEEVAEILAVVNEGETYYDVENRLQEPRDVLTICSGLVDSTEFYRKIKHCGEATKLKGLKLSHFSVKEYLTLNRIVAAKLSGFVLNERDAHELLAKLCINYLLWCGREALCQDPQEWLAFGRIPHRSAFALYAGSFWSLHLQAARIHHSAPLYDKYLKMLRFPALLTDVIMLGAVGVNIEDTETIDFRSKYLYRDTGLLTIHVAIGDIPPLYYVSMLGLDDLVLKLLAAGEEVNSFGRRLTSMAAAAFFGHRTTVQLLLDNGAEINAVVRHAEYGDKECYSPTAIQCAAETGREEIVNMLITKGADVSTCCARPPRRGWAVWRVFNTPLESAVGIPGAVRTRIVRSLLDAGADVHACGHGGSAELLYHPISQGDTDLITQLLDAGVDFGDHDSSEDPLLWAISGCQRQCVKLLVERGARLKTTDSRLVPALLNLRHTKKFRPAVQIALEVEPNLNTELLLFVAAKYGHVDSVKLLLRNGAAPDVFGENGVAALHAAAFTPEDNTQIVELLLDAHADVSIHGGLFGSALQAAALSGKAEVVRILLKHGASPNHSGGLYGTALQLAQNRLEDLERSRYRYTYTSDFRHYGPNGYYHITPKTYYLSEHKPFISKLFGDNYIPHFEFGHLPNADYRAVIDALQSQSAL